MRYKFIYFIVVLIFSCGEETPLTPEEEAAMNRQGIDLSMSDKLVLSISVNNFPVAVSVLGFELIYDPDAITYSSYSSGDYTVTFATESVSDSIGISFIFVGNISKNGQLLTISFQGSENSYKYSTIYLSNFVMYDNNGNELMWEGFSSPGVCYIDKHPTNGDEYGDYSWRNECFPLNYDPTDIYP